MAGDPGADERHLAEFAGADELGGALEVRSAAPLRADLHDAIVLAGGLDHAAALDEIVRDGLLDVDMLAGLTGPDGGQGVPVVRRGDADGVDVAVLEDAAEVFDDLRRPLLSRVDDLQGVVGGVFIRIADGGDLDAFQGGKAAKPGRVLDH